jgi:hypothetical protein
VTQLSEVTTKTVRDKLARLCQMATLLSLESAEELLDYWGENAGALTWRLAPSEARAVLGQRVEFVKERIMALPL